jgi:arylsulfatase A-like enzyme
MTGLVPHRSGALGFDPVSPGTPTLPGLLRARGYYTAVMNKRLHMTPDAAFPWDMKFGRSGKEPTLWTRQVADAMKAAGEAKKPFFINANIVDPHRPFPGSGGSQAGRKDATSASPEKVYAASEVAVPSFLEDLPAVREEIAQYYTAVARMDQSLERILGALEDAGHADDTIVVFLGDNGMSFPFSKGTVFRNGTHEPLLLRWPGMGRPQRREHFVSSVDVLPTLLELLGVPAPRPVLLPPPPARRGREPRRDHARQFRPRRRTLSPALHPDEGLLADVPCLARRDAAIAHRCDGGPLVQRSGRRREGESAHRSAGRAVPDGCAADVLRSENRSR